MGNSTTNGVIGTDGIVPIYDPEGLWKTWSIGEIWLGPDLTGGTANGQPRHVPKVKDYVRDPDSYETWIVDHLDPVSLTPTLRSIKPSMGSDSFTELEVLFGVEPGPQLETWRAYLNDSVFPHTLALDPRFMPKGSMSSYAKIFLGVDTTANGKVISKIYDASGNFISSAIPLELVALDSHTNYAVKQVRRCNITEQLPNGEVITCVIYADDGHVVQRRQFLIENTDTIADVTQGMKYISEISLESPWLSPTSPDQLDYPLNIPMDALNLIGVVHYSDGSTMKLPVDGGKFSMLGLEGRLSSIVGQPHNLVLRYQMSPGETAYASTGVNGIYVTKPYKIVTTNPNNSIAVKLFGYPFWEGEQFGYRMKWYLFNLERNVFFDATSHVQYTESTGPYDPKLYGYLQRKRVTVNLRSVSPTFIPFIHPQVVDIVLNHPPENKLVPDWTVLTESSDTHPRYGVEVYGELKQNGLVSFKAGHATYEEWLVEYYHKTLPLINPVTEVRPVAPTHFIVDYKGTRTEWSVTDWDKDLSISLASVQDKETVTIRFISRKAAGDLQLSISAAIIKKL